MEIIKARKLKYDYLKYDENGQASESQTAVENVDLDIQPGQFISILDTTVPENLPWQSI